MSEWSVGDVVFAATKGWRDLELVRATVTAASPKQISLSGDDGERSAGGPFRHRTRFSPDQMKAFSRTASEAWERYAQLEEDSAARHETDAEKCRERAAAARMNAQKP